MIIGIVLHCIVPMLLFIRALSHVLGIPTMSSVVLVNVYPPEPNARNMTFIMRGYPEEKEAVEILSKVTGGRVKIKKRIFLQLLGPSYYT